MWRACEACRQQQANRPKDERFRRGRSNRSDSEYARAIKLNLSKNVDRTHPAYLLWDWCEALVGLLAVFVMTFVIPTVAGLVAVLALLMAEWWVCFIALAIVSPTAPMAVWLAKMAENAFKEFRQERWIGTTKESRTPFGVWLARQLPTIPFLLRFPLAFWWMSHFLAGVIVVEFRSAIARELGLPVPGGLALIVFCFAFQFAANVFLMLAIGCAQTSVEITESVWRYRFWINGMILLALVARLFF